MEGIRTVLLIIAVMSGQFGYWFWIGGYIAQIRQPNKKAAIVCFLITTATFIANIIIEHNLI